MKKTLEELILRTIIGLVMGFVFFAFALLSAEGYEMRNLIGGLGFICGFIFVYNDSDNSKNK